MTLLLPDGIAELVGAEKRLAARPKWDAQSDPRYFVFTAPLMVENVLIGGFELRAKASRQNPQRDALMQLEFVKSARERIGLARCQWRPFETHTNKNWGPPGHELRAFHGTSHHHTFEQNYLPDECRMRAGSLPAAIPIHPDPTSLSGFIAFAASALKSATYIFSKCPTSMRIYFGWKNDRSH